MTFWVWLVIGLFGGAVLVLAVYVGWLWLGYRSFRSRGE